MGYIVAETSTRTLVKNNKMKIIALFVVFALAVQYGQCDPIAKAKQQMIQRAFTAFDKDKSGTISTEELRTLMQREGSFGEEEITEEDAQQVMDVVDVDGNGSLDFPEFSTMMNEVLSYSLRSLGRKLKHRLA